MKKIVLYRTTSWGGIDGSLLMTRTFETAELAKADALKDTWNEWFKLYKVIITFNGVVTEEEKFICEIPCGRDREITKN